jgi:hypothetical protein
MIAAIVSLLKFLPTLEKLIELAIAVYTNAKRAQESKDAQTQRDKIEADPAGSFAEHFSNPNSVRAQSCENAPASTHEADVKSGN